MKALFSLLVLSLWAGEPARAQSQPAPVPARVGVGQRRIGSDTPPTQLAEEESIRLAGQLSLSPAQLTQVQAAALKRAQAHQALLRKYEAMHFSGAVPPAEGQAIENEFEAQLQAICTPEQYARRQTIQARFRRLRARADSLSQVPQHAARNPK